MKITPPEPVNILFKSLLNDSYDHFVQKLFNYSSLVNSTNNNGESLLHFCCLFGIIDKYYALINVGAIPTLTVEGNNLLHYACFSGKDNFLVTELIKSPILPNELNINKQSSLHFCANEQIAHYLNLWCIRNRINITELIDKDGNNVAHSCMLYGYQSSALYWIKNYPELNEQLNSSGKKWNENFINYYQYS